jgi:hypothetical protein
MRIGRLVLTLAGVAAILWAIQNRDSLLSRIHAPQAAAASAARSDTALAEASREADKAQGGGGVTENMTPDQVRALLGTPDSIEPSTTDAGKSREKWIYRQAGKAVVFENGVAVSIESP